MTDRVLDLRRGNVCHALDMDEGKMSNLKELKNACNQYNTPWQLMIPMKMFFLNLILAIFLIKVEADNIFFDMLVLFLVFSVPGAWLYVTLSIALSVCISLQYKYLLLVHPLFTGKRIWVNQWVNPFCKAESCPKTRFLKDLVVLKKRMPKGIVFRCCTHQKIRDVIANYFVIIESTECYEKNLIKEMKQLRNTCCDECSDLKCSYIDEDSMPDEITQFYGIEFKHKPS